MIKFILFYSIFFISSTTVIAQKTWVGSGAGGGGTDFNTASNWLPIGVPGASDDVNIPLTNPGNIFLSSNTSVRNFNLTLNGNNHVARFNIRNFSLTINGTTNVEIVTLGNPNTFLIFGSDSISSGIVECVGNATFGLSNPGGSLNTGMFVVPAGGVNSSFIFRGNYTQGMRTGSYATEEPGSLIFDGTGTQNYIVDNMFDTYYRNISIGSSNNPTVNLSGISYALASGNMTINGSSVLNLGSRNWNRLTAGGILSVPSSGRLILGGSTNGILNSNFPSNYSTYTLDSTSTVEFNGVAQTIPGAVQLVTSYGNLTTSGTNVKSLGSDISVFRQLSIGAATTLTLGNFHATLKSNNRTTAYVAPITPSLISYSGTGRFIVERSISRLRKWHYLSVPADSLQSIKNAWQEGSASLSSNPVPGYGMQITNAPGTTCVGCDAISPGGHSVKMYNPATNGYTGIASTTNTGIKTTAGYMAFTRGDRLSLSSSSNPTNPTVLRTKGMLYAGTQPTINIADNRFAGIGNPYASAINLLNITTTNLIGFTSARATVYLWDPSLSGTFGLGGFQTLTFNGSNYSITPGGGSIYTTGTMSRIESGQAFFVRAINGSAGSLTFAENSKTTGSALASFSSSLPSLSLSRSLRTSLYVATSGVSELLDGSLVYFDDSFNDGEDNMDAEKMVNTSENFGIKSAGRTLVVDYRSLPGTGDTIFLNFANSFIRSYQLEIDAANLHANGRTAFLEDKYLNRVEGVDLNGKITYLFEIENIPGSYAADRFRIIFKQEIFPVVLTDITAERNADHSVAVRWNVENEINVATLEIESTEDKISFTKQGNAVPLNNNGAEAYTFTDSKASLNALYYRIKSTEANGNIKYSSIAKVGAVTDISAGFSVYPNPVTEGKLNIRFTNQVSGIYVINVWDNKGQLIHREKINVNDLHSLKTVSLNPLLAAGAYRVTLTDNAGNKTTVPFIVP